MSEGKSRTVDINPCPVCGLEHIGLELPEVQAAVSVRIKTRTKVVLICPSKNEYFSVLLEGYE
jgi:hypothetical protein